MKVRASIKKICNKCDCLPITEKMAKGVFSLPLYPNIKKSEILRVTKVLKKILRKI